MFCEKHEIANELNIISADSIHGYISFSIGEGHSTYYKRMQPFISWQDFLTLPANNEYTSREINKPYGTFQFYYFPLTFLVLEKRTIHFRPKLLLRISDEMIQGQVQKYTQKHTGQISACFGPKENRERVMWACGRRVETLPIHWL